MFFSPACVRPALGAQPADTHELIAFPLFCVCFALELVCFVFGVAASRRPSVGPVFVVCPSRVSFGEALRSVRWWVWGYESSSAVWSSVCEGKLQLGFFKFKVLINDVFFHLIQENLKN